MRRHVPLLSLALIGCLPEATETDNTALIDDNTALIERLDALEADMSAMRDEIDAKDEQITTLNATLTALGVDVEALDGEVVALTTELDAVQVTVGEHGTQIADHETRIATLEGGSCTCELGDLPTRLASMEGYLNNESPDAFPFEDGLATANQLNDLATSIAATYVMQAELDDLEAHQRAVAEEVIGEVPSADLGMLTTQLADSRIDDLDVSPTGSCPDTCATDSELEAAIAGIDIPGAEDVAQWLGFPGQPEFLLDQTYIAIVDVQGEIAGLDTSYVTHAELAAEDYATENWVNGREFLTAASLAGLATESWVATEYPEQAEVDLLAASVMDHEERISDLEDRIGVVGGGDHVRILNEGWTLQVPAEYPTVQDALDTLASWRIASDVYATIQIAPSGSMYELSTLEVRHPDGDRIRILGDVSAPESVVLQFAMGNGIQVNNGHVLGMIDGLTIRGPGREVSDGFGVLVSSNSVIHIGSSVLVEGWAFGLHARDNSFADIRAGTRFREISQTAVRAGAGGTVSAPGVVIDSVETGFNADGGTVYAQDSNLTYSSVGIGATNGGRVDAVRVTMTGVAGSTGVHAERGSVINVDGSTVTGGSIGFYAEEGAILSCADCGASMLTGTGFHADTGSLLTADHARSHDNEGYGYLCDNGSTLIADGSSATYNLFSGYHINQGSMLRGRSLHAESNEEHGLALEDGSVADVKMATITDSGFDGFRAHGGSYMDATDSQSSANDGSGYVVSFDSAMYGDGAEAIDNSEVGVELSRLSAIMSDGITMSGNTLGGSFTYGISYMHARSTQGSQAVVPPPTYNSCLETSSTSCP